MKRRVGIPYKVRGNDTDFFSFTQDCEFNKKPISKLGIGNINYLNFKSEENKESKKNLLGLVGTLSETELKKLINEVLTPIGYNLIVSPKEIDFLIDKLANVIGNGINRALHKDINNL